MDKDLDTIIVTAMVLALVSFLLVLMVVECYLYF